MTTPDKTFNEAKQLYMEQYGNAIVTGTYLKIALFLMALGLVLSIAVNLRTIGTFRDFRPLVIRVDDVGRAEAVDYHDLEYKPQDAEAKYFLTQFCRLYYRRNRFTVQDDLAKSVYFLDGPLANATLDGFAKSNSIKTFLANQNGPDIDIEVKKVALEDMSAPPYKARVDFYMVYYSAADRSEIKRVLYTANFVFFFKSKVPNNLIPINPLGMAISYFREDEAFAGGTE